MLDTYEQNSKKKLVATILTVLVIAGAVVLADHFKTEDTVATLVPSTTTSPSTPTTSAAATSTDTSSNTTTPTTPTSGLSSYKDGTFTAASDYYVPQGNESIEVSLTINGGVITDVAIQNSEGDRDSARYQEVFAASYKSYVVGKKISGLKIGIIAGASDTTDGFNDALSQIATKAQA